MVIKTVYHFVDSNLEVEISSKKRVNRKRRGSFGSSSTWEGENLGRKDWSGGPGVRENYTD